MAAVSNTIRLNGQEAVLDGSGALWVPSQRLLVVADLHLEKGSSFARRGSLLPPYDSAATVARLTGLLDRLQPAEVVCLGDSFHDRDAELRLDLAVAERLAGLVARQPWTWILGNHDPRPPAMLGGDAAESLVRGPLQLRHEPSGAWGTGEVVGHFHPKARARLRTGSTTRPCFVSDGRRLILPSFGAFTGGLDVLAPTIRDRFPGGFLVWLLGRTGVHRLHAAQLAPLAAAF